MAAATTSISVRVDKALKDRADEFFNEVGMNMSTAINIFLRQTLRLGRIPFSIAVNRPNEETMAALIEGERLAYDTAIKGYGSAEELFAALDAESEENE